MGISTLLFKHRRKYRLSYRLLAYILLCSTIFTFISTAFQLFIEYKKDVKRVEDGINQIRESYLNFLSLSLWDMNEQQLTLQMKGALLLPDIQYLEIREIRGNIEDVFCSVGTPKEHGVASYHFPLVHQARHEKMLIGKLYVTVNLDGVYQRLYDRVTLILMTQAVKTFMWSFCVLFIFQYFIMRNLNIITRYLLQFDMTRLNIPLTLDRKTSTATEPDELEHVVTAINKMRKNLSHYITERRKAEEALQNATVKYRIVADNTYDWEFWLSPAGDFIYISPSCKRITGYEADEFHADPGLMGRIVHQDDRLHLADHRHDMVQTMPPGEVEYRIVRPDGTICWIGHVCQPVFDEKGNFLGTRGSNRDITERKRAEDELARHRDHLGELVQERTAALEEARNKARQYLDIAGVILVAIDTDRRVTLINQKGCEVLQSTSAEIIGKDWFETFVPENVRRDVIEAFRRLMAGQIEAVKYFENDVLTQGGEERLIAWHNALLRDDEGNITGTLSSGEDITEKKRAEEQIIRLNQDLRKRAAELEAANKELEGFTYSVSHDLRAPLRHIDGFLELLQKKAGTALDEQARHYMDNISDASKKMGLLIDDLLSFSRMGRAEMSRTQVDLNDLLQEVIRELGPETQGRSIHWRITHLPIVTGDPAMLRIVLVNLISNALKFTQPREQAEIEIRSTPAHDGETIVFVRDNGVGFDMDYADKLFGVFQRLHHADKFEGTGIGLATVRRIINRHGGRTWAEGEIDHGAIFYFSLPQFIQEA